MFTDLKPLFSSFKSQKPQKDPQKHKWTSSPVIKVEVLSASFLVIWEMHQRSGGTAFFRSPCLEMKTNFYPALRQTDICCTQVQKTSKVFYDILKLFYKFFRDWNKVLQLCNGIIPTNTTTTWNNWLSISSFHKSRKICLCFFKVFQIVITEVIGL